MRRSKKRKRRNLGDEFRGSHVDGLGILIQGHLCIGVCVCVCLGILIQGHLYIGIDVIKY
jgi:hypothetical protein